MSALLPSMHIASVPGMKHRATLCVLGIAALCLGCALGARPVRANGFVERWIVVLGAYKSEEAARKAAANTPNASVLASDGFSGLSPGYVLLVLGPFTDRANAQAARDKSGIKEAYLRFTGPTRGPAAPDVPAPQAKPRTDATASNASCSSHRCWSHPSLTPPLIAAIEGWEQAERSKPGRTGFEILDVMPNSNGNSTLVIREKRQTAKSCERGYREANVLKADGMLRIVGAREAGYRCCDDGSCDRHDPSSFMLRLLESEDVRWAIASQKGVVVDAGDGKPKTVGRAGAQSDLLGLVSFNPLYDSFECPAAWTDGVAMCSKWTGGENYEFSWRRTPGGAVLERLQVIYQER